MSIRHYLRAAHSFSRRLLSSIATKDDAVFVNGLPEKLTYRLKAGDQLTIHLPPEKKGSYMTPEKINLDIIYEDAEILIINKEPRMVTTPSPHYPSGTVANGILYYYEQNQIENTVHVVTRLDRNTSGLLIIAKNRYMHSLLSTAMAKGKIKRAYKAIVEGKLEPKQGVIDAKIGRKEGSIIERAVMDNGKTAITHYKVEQEMGDFTLVNVELATGRTHQIRVHFSHIGHPLVGDTLYGGNTEHIDRQALHCYEVRLKHPLTNEVIVKQTPIPDDMKKLLTT